MSARLSDLRYRALRDALRGRSAAVVGLGKSGTSAASCLLRLGAKVFLSESRPRSKALPGLPPALRRLDAEFGGHSEKLLVQDLVVVSPGVEWSLPVLAEARRRGLPVWSELEFGFRLTRFKKLAAVTGTNGKTTTTALLGDLCRRAGFSTLVAGNIGRPLADFTFSEKKYRVAVLEVSSYQLEGIDRFRPDVAVALNLTSDHLHRHGTMRNYAAAKERIFSNQSGRDSAVANFDDARCRAMGRRAPSRMVWFSTRRRLSTGVYYDRDRRAIVARLGKSAQTFPLPTHLPGLHNVENACAAVAAGLRLGAPPKAIRSSLLNFPGVPHRLEKIRELSGVSFVNDSKGTNVDSTLKALESFPGPLWIILGGEDKGSPYDPLKPLLREKAKGALLIGEAAKRIYNALKGSCPLYFCGALPSAVRQAFERAAPGDLVLLSPACASFDQYGNFEERGEHFKRLAAALRPKR